jgi:hypothetical protein
MLSENKTKIVGLLLVIFGALQAFSEQVRGLLSPTGYVVFTIIVGVVVTTLGAIKKGEGSLLTANRTWLTGVLLIALGALQGFSADIQALVSPAVFSGFTIFTGIGVAVLGFLNSQSSSGGGSSEGGFARPGALVMLFCAAVAVAGLAGCAGTRDAYKAAAGNLEATAYVVTEHYAAVVKEAAALKNSGALSGSALEAVRKADDAVRPLVIGDSATETPGVVQLVEAYREVRNAETERELQAAINAAVVKLSDLINALKRR